MMVPDNEKQCLCQDQHQAGMALCRLFPLQLPKDISRFEAGREDPFVRNFYKV
jgi:hypothetical protein